LLHPATSIKVRVSSIQNQALAAAKLSFSEAGSRARLIELPKWHNQPE